MTLNFRKVALTGTIAFGTLVGAMSPAFSMSVGEYYAFVKDCHSRGGTTGVYENGQLGCRGGIAAVDNGGINEILVPTKEQISKLSIEKLPTKMRAETQGDQVLKSDVTSRGRLANDWAVSEMK
ncbi:hypothetical protein [Celeribacter halophilus]|nr:hypothetical protein [Celeribacter halophilus]